MADSAQLAELKESAKSVREYSAAPDGVVLQAIGMGIGTRQELRDVLGFGYDVIEKCLERNSAEIRTRQYGSIDRFELASAAVSASSIVQYLCVECGGPRSVGSATRCKSCYSKPKEIAAKAAQETSMATGDELNCGCGRPASHIGRCSFRREKAQREKDQQTPSSDDAQIVAPVRGLRGKYQVKYEGLTVYCDSEKDIDVLINRLQERNGSASEVIDTRPTAGPAWPTDFEDQSIDGMPGLTLCYIMGLLHVKMSQREQEAVWTLVMYIKRMQSLVEDSKS